MRIAHFLSVCGLAVLVAACAHPSSAVADDSDAAQARSSQKIMLDPDTGDIDLVSPEQPGDNGRTAASPNQAAGTHNGGKAGTTDPSTGADDPVVHCPDGSLRMGHAKDGDSSDAPGKLCADR